MLSSKSMLNFQQKWSDMKNYMEMLQTCPLFAGILPDELLGLLDCLGGSKLYTLKGQPIFREGDPATHLGIVLEGAVRMERQDYYGNRSIIAHIGPGELFAETYACAGVQALPISVVADENSHVLIVDCRRITVSCCNACSFHSRIIHNLLYLVATKNILFDRKLQVTAKRTTREKLMAYLMDQMKLQGNPSFTIPYDRQELADYLEVDRSGLSAEISKLRKEGVLESHKNYFRIL